MNSAHVRQKSLKPQGRCETTLTERFDVGGCSCPTYEGNLGPCKTFELGGNERCAYCDHTKECHSHLLYLAESKTAKPRSTKGSIMARTIREQTNGMSEEEQQANLASAMRIINASRPKHRRIKRRKIYLAGACAEQ